MWRGTFNRSEHKCRNFNSARNLLRHGDCNCNMRITQIGVKHKWRQYDKEDWEDWSAIFFILSFFFLFFCSLTTCFGNNVWANLCCRHRLLLHILVWIHSATYNYRTLQREAKRRSSWHTRTETAKIRETQKWEATNRDAESLVWRLRDWGEMLFITLWI